MTTQPPEEAVTFACDSCTKSFYLKALLTHHIRNVHERPTYECEYCEKKMSSRVTQRAHQWSCELNPLQFSQADMDKAIVAARRDWDRDLVVQKKRGREEDEHQSIVAKRVRAPDDTPRGSLALNPMLFTL